MNEVDRMKNVTMYLMGAAAMASASTSLPAQQLPPHVRKLGSITGASLHADPDNYALLPNGRVVLYAADSALVALDLVSKTRVQLARGEFASLAISPRGDRIAWHRHQGTDGSNYIWSMAINPQTGAPRGPAGMVSQLNGNSARFSPDGKSIAFGQGRGSLLSASDREELIVVPATGGPERHLGQYAVHFKADWSSDGNWLLVKTRPDSSGQWIERVPVAGGPGQRLFTVPEAAGIGGALLSTDGQVAFYRSKVDPRAALRDEGRISYLTASGTRGELRVPPGAQWASSAWTPGSSHALLIYVDRPTTAYALDLATGRTRVLGDSSRDPAWSPDGRRVAMQTGSGSNFDITVMNADGSGARRYPLKLDAQPGALIKWSPDGRMLAFRAGLEDDIALLDLATGEARALTRSPGTVDGYVWRPDGQSLVIARNKVTWDRPTAGDEQLAVYEVRLDGSERMLRDLWPVDSGFIGATFVSDRLLALASHQKRILVPVEGGAARTLPGPGANNTFETYVSTDGKRLLTRTLGLPLTGNRGITRLGLMTIDGDSLRTIDLPFSGHPSPWIRPVLHPDGQQAVLLGQSNGDSVWKFFSVPLRGGVPRELGKLPGYPLREQFALSPDGRSLAYTAPAAETTVTFYDLDLSSIPRGSKP